MDALSTSHIGQGILKIFRGGGCGRGYPLPHQGVFAFLGFKISDLLHTFGEFDDVQPMRKELEGVGGGIPLPHRGVYAFSEFKIRDLVHTLGEFVKYCLSKI